MATSRQFPSSLFLEHVLNCRTHKACSVAAFALDSRLEVNSDADTQQALHATYGKHREHTGGMQLHRPISLHRKSGPQAILSADHPGGIMGLGSAGSNGYVYHHLRSGVRKRIWAQCPSLTQLTKIKQGTCYSILCLIGLKIDIAAHHCLRAGKPRRGIILARTWEIAGASAGHGLSIADGRRDPHSKAPAGELVINSQ